MILFSFFKRRPILLTMMMKIRGVLEGQLGEGAQPWLYFDILFNVSFSPQMSQNQKAQKPEVHKSENPEGKSLESRKPRSPNAKRPKCQKPKKRGIPEARKPRKVRQLSIVQKQRSPKAQKLKKPKLRTQIHMQVFKKFF